MGCRNRTGDRETVVELQGVQLRRSGRSILNGVTWTIGPGEHWTFIGPNGSGKTMTLKIVNGYVWPTEGSVRVLGRRFGEFDIRELRKEIGWVSMDLQYQLQRPFPALEVVLSGYTAAIGLYQEMPAWMHDRARELLDFFECGSLEQRPFHTLSYGEQKRIMIARALINSPRLLILDEPCTGLDLVSRERFLEQVQNLGERPGGPAIVLVTHHVEEIMPFVTHCHLIRDGATFACGPKEELVTGANLSATLGLDVQVYRKNGRYWASIGSENP
jgi:iron complex transport system ATP-binding protein